MKSTRYHVVQRVTKTDDVLVSRHNSYAAARRVLDKALPGDQAEMRIVDTKEATPPCSR